MLMLVKTPPTIVATAPGRRRSRKDMGLCSYLPQSNLRYLRYLRFLFYLLCWPTLPDFKFIYLVINLHIRTMLAHIHKRTHIHLHTYIHIHTHTNAPTNTHARTHAHTHTHKRTNTHARTQTHIQTHTYTHTHTHAHKRTLSYDYIKYILKYISC